MSDFLGLLTTDFIVYALAAGLSLALVAGPLGSFIVWRRMSYFGDTLAHSALLGIAIGLLTNANPQLSIIVSCLFFAFILTVLDRSPKVSTDTLLGILAHSSLALGIVVLALADSVRVNLEAYLFGALLTISESDLVWIIVVALGVGGVLLRFWNEFVAITVHPDIAEIEGSSRSFQYSSGAFDRPNDCCVDENRGRFIDYFAFSYSGCGGSTAFSDARTNGSAREPDWLRGCGDWSVWRICCRCPSRPKHRCVRNRNISRPHTRARRQSLGRHVTRYRATL